MTELALLKRWRDSGDAAAFNEIALMYAPLVYGVCVRILGNATEAQDAAQDCFVTLARTSKLPKDGFPAWLHVVAANCARKHLRADRRRHEREKQFAAGIPVQTEVNWDEISPHVDDAIQALPIGLHELVVAHFLQGQSQSSIATASGVSRQTVSNRIGQAVELIRDVLKRKGILASSVVLTVSLTANGAIAVPSNLTSELGKIALAGPSLGVASTSWLASLVSLKAASVAACAIAVGSIVAYMSLPTPTPPPPATKQTLAAKQTPAERSEPTPNKSDIAEKQGTGSKRLEQTAPASRPVTSVTDSKQGSVVSGVILLPDGRPFAGAIVRLQLAPRDIDAANRTEAESDGTFRFEGIAPGTYGVQVNGPMHWCLANPSEVSEVTIRAGEDITNLRLVYGSEGNLAIEGQVVDSRGLPISGANVHSYGNVERYTTTDRNGNFQLRFLSAGNYRVFADKNDGKHSDAAAIADAGDRNVKVVMPGVGRVEGRVIQANTGKPMMHFEVGFMNGHATTIHESLFGNMKSFSNKDGRFSLEDVYVGELTIIARATGFAPSTALVTLQENETLSDIEIRLPLPGQVHGHVVSSDGLQIEGAMVYLGECQSRDILMTPTLEKRVRTDSGGAFTVSDVSADSHVVSAFHPDYADGSAPIAEDTIITLEKPATLRATVLDRGQPAYKSHIRVWNLSAVRHSYVDGGIADANGVVAVQGLNPGFVHIEAAVSEARTQNQEIELKPGQDTEVSFDFDPAGATMDGRVTVTGEPARWVELTLHIETDATPEQIKIRPKSDGSYAMSDIPTGTATMVVHVYEDDVTERIAHFYNIRFTDQQATHYDVDLTGSGDITGRISGLNDREAYLNVLAGSLEFNEAKEELKRGDSPISHAAWVKVGLDGNFSAKNLEPGTYTVVAMFRSKADWITRDYFASSVVKVENDSTTPLEIACPR